MNKGGCGVDFSELASSSLTDLDSETRHRTCHACRSKVDAGAAPATEQRNLDSTVAGVVEEACELKKGGNPHRPGEHIERELGRK
ncbi:hypothetical protein CGMCC3_g11518 [Colletotrichum fructicola]|nr:uncharacterized protein CGMCC3_g11518 [Colletotrichum fructicola]KAE9572542.1 hypothetical protein CGMCC3_g11518 [Colletotrichum fructicola]